MNKHDPITRLTAAEKKFVRHLEQTSTREQVLARLKADLQTAVEIELATIPIYLYTYYSLQRSETSGENMDEAQLFVNKAGGAIMSVAVEEMLHMSLSANILYALGGTPEVYKKSPGPYPTGLPFHNPVGPKGPDGNRAVSIPLAKLSYEQLWHFLQIEYPETADAMPEDQNWDTIGQFYSAIRCMIMTKFITDADFQSGALASQIQDYNYSPNNVDTVYPKSKFDPWKPASGKGPLACPAHGANQVAVYPSQPDSHAGKAELLSIGSKRDALLAIDTICDQGEGYAQPKHGAGEYDDPSKTEQSHYYKFLSLQAQYEGYDPHHEILAKSPKAPKAIKPTVRNDAPAAGDKSKAVVLGDLVLNFPTNPTTAFYPAQYRAISDFCNGLFQYMLIMTETVYRVPPQNQKLFFNEGLHRSMIWVLDKFIRTMRNVPIEEGAYKGKIFAPTFEFVDLGERKDSFANLTALGSAAIAAAQNIADQQPNSDLASAMGKIVYYVQSAVSLMNGGHPQHLPDVSQYW